MSLYSNYETALQNCLKAHEDAKTKTIIPYRQSSFNVGGAIPTDWNLEGYLSAYGTIGWLHAVVFRIALGCSEVEWTLFDITNQDKPKQIYKHPILSLLHLVNPFQTSNEFIALDTIYNELLGESFWALNLNGFGEPAEIILPYPHKMSVVPAKEFPFVRGYVYGVGAEAIPFDINEIIHFKYPNPLNQYRGLAPAKAIGVNLSAEQNADKWVNQFFYNSARPDGIIQFDYNLSDEQFEKLKKQWKQEHQGITKAHYIALLEGGGKYIQIQNSIKDMDFPNLKQKNRDVILGVFGMPQSVMGISENVNKANAEAGDYTFARWIVKPRLDWKKAKIQEQLIPKFKHSENLQIDFKEVVPETIEQKIQIAESGLRAGYKTVNEARIVVGDDPLPPEVGDVLLIPLNLIPTPITKPIQPPTPPPTGENPEEELEQEPSEAEVPLFGEQTESFKGGEGSGNFGHEGRPGEVGGSGDGGGGGGVSEARNNFIRDKVRVTGRSQTDKDAIGKVEAEIKSAGLPDSHLETVRSIEINTVKVNAMGGMAVAYADGSNNIFVNGKVGYESVVHEIGHTYFQKKILVAGNKDKWETANIFNACTKTGKGFVSSYARTDPLEFFAESYAAFAQNPKGFAKLNPPMAKILTRHWK